MQEEPIGTGDTRSAASGIAARRSRSRRWLLLGPLALGAALTIVLGAAHLRDVRRGPSAVRPANERQIAFVDDRACAECHPAEHQRWSGSHHAKAMQPADPTTVRGDFSDVRFSQFRVTSRFFKRDGKFVVNTEGPDGRAANFEVKYTLGVEPLQQYLIEFPGGRLQSLTIAWDTERKRWFSLYPNQRIAPGNPLHWTGRYQNWNLMCAECHTTNLRKGYVADSDSYQTVWSELNVGCQACHGPGQGHVDWAAARRGQARNGGDVGLVVNFRTGDSRFQVDNCARCHSRRTRLTAQERPGRLFLDEFSPSVLRAGLYYADGQQLGEVYEYGSYRQSKMYQQGVRCTDCHEPHAAKLRAVGNALCTRCHGEAKSPRLPGSRPGVYDSPAHHFHQPGSAGAQCVNCHMPDRRYMVVHLRRDHSFPIPRPDRSAKLGTPNACNSCHADRSRRWAAAALEQWWGPAPRDTSYAKTIAAGRAGAPDAGPRLQALAGDGAQPAIVRATALELLRDYGAAGIRATRTALSDEDPVVRLAAVGGLEHLPPAERLKSASSLLNDPVRSVRTEAARVLASVPADLLTSASERAALEVALAEFEQAQIAMSDMPSARLNLGVVHERLGRVDRAEQSYKAALEMDPSLVPARTNLAALYNAMGRNADAERVLRAGLTRTPAEGELHYSLGLVLLGEEQRLSEAADELADAARLLPRRARVLYNYGLALQQLGRRRQAEAALQRAHVLGPADPQIVYALAVFYAQQQQYERALPYARLLTELAPDSRARQFSERLSQAAQAVRRGK
jgi:predicted CXXCH cytochrome family protein